MTFGLFLPEEADEAPVPVLWYLVWPDLHP